ncbi:hypothetical protein N9E28_02390 [Alphaproteobacteria bacterium]|nr:hypothetical protein [Alphaproteobacteria bacterium]
MTMNKMKKLFMLAIVASITFITPKITFAGFWSSESDWEKITPSARGDYYRRNVKKRGNIITFETLEDLYSPLTNDSKIIRSMIYYQLLDCQQNTENVTALEFYSGQMATGNSWVGPASNTFELSSSHYDKYCR